MTAKKGLVLPSLLTTGVLALLFASILGVTEGLTLIPDMIPPSGVRSSNTAATNSQFRYNLNTGAAFNISCFSTHISVAFTVSFYKDGVAIGDGDLVNTTLTETVPSTTQKFIVLEFLNFQPVQDGVYHCFASASDTDEDLSSDLYLYGSEFPPPPAVRVSPRYVVLDTSADLVLEARFRGSFTSHEWGYNENDPTFISNVFSLFTPATVTNVGQTYTIPAGSASLRVGYYGPRVNPTLTGTAIRPTPENTVIVGSFFAATAFIDGLSTAQVTAAAGDDVTFTCLTRGFPETTITIQLSVVDASYTIGNQTLMTEATPTSFMEVTRTVTLHSVTVLDCGAVVTCEGSNMNSDGSTHTDQAAATLQVQAPPTVGVTPSEPVLSVGDMLTLTCTGGDCVGTTTFTFSWFLDGSPVEASLVTSIDGTTSQLSVTSVTSADFGTYTCNVMNEHGTGSAVAYVREGATTICQLYLRPVSDCLTWVESNTEAKLSDISAALYVSLQQDCSCSLSVQQSLFSCLGTEDSQTVVFLARLSYAALPGVDLPSLLTAWVGSTPPITVASTQLQVDTTCPVVIDSLEPKSCIITAPPPDVSVIAAASGSSVAVLLVVLIIAVTMVIVGSVYFKRSRSRPKRPLPNPEYEYEYVGSGSGGVALTNMMQNPAYVTAGEEVTSFSSSPEEDKEKDHTYDVLPFEANEEMVQGDTTHGGQGEAADDVHVYANQ